MLDEAILKKCLFGIGWCAKLAIPGSIFVGDRNYFDHPQDSIPYSLSLSSSHSPDMTELLLKET